MHVDGTLVLGAAVVGFLVGMTGAGGGALMTPMLIFLFGVSPSAAISSDLVANVVMRPVGAAVHLRRGKVQLPVVGWLAAGSVPGAFLGSYLLHLMGSTRAAQHRIEVVLGAALLLGAAAMVVRVFVRSRRVEGEGVRARPLPTVAVGALGGVLVGLTSVGSGSLMIILLAFVYPALTSSALVGTDLVQAIPLMAAAALGQLLFGHVEVAVTASVVLGSVPGVLAGSLLSSRAPDHLVRPAIAAVLVVSGARYVGLGSAATGWVAAVVVLAAVAWALWAPRRRRDEVGGSPAVAPVAVPVVAPGEQGGEPQVSRR